MEQNYLDFTPAKQAKVAQGEFANLADVTRTTTNSWYNGGSIHRLLFKKVSVLLAAIQLAVDNNQLPLPDGLPADERRELLRMVISRYVLEAKAK